MLQYVNEFESFCDYSNFSNSDVRLCFSTIFVVCSPLANRNRRIIRTISPSYSRPINFLVTLLPHRIEQNWLGYRNVTYDLVPDRLGEKNRTVWGIFQLVPIIINTRFFRIRKNLACVYSVSFHFPLRHFFLPPSTRTGCGIFHISDLCWSQRNSSKTGHQPNVQRPSIRTQLHPGPTTLPPHSWMNEYHNCRD